MKKTLILVALLSVTTFSAMADELKTMTQEQVKVQTQTQTQNQVRNQEKEVQWQSTIPDEQVAKKETAYNQGTESQKQSQSQNQVQTQTQTKTQSQMQNRIQPMQPQMGNRMQTHTGGSGSRGH